MSSLFTNSQVEGFPSPDEVRTFYVEHDIDGSEEETSVLEFILSDKRILATEADVIETLASVGFSDERQAQAIGFFVRWLEDEARPRPGYALQGRHPPAR